MRILWICQKLPPEADALIGGDPELKSTGGWIVGMAGELTKDKSIKLAIVAASSLVNSVKVVHGTCITYFILPFAKSEKDQGFIRNCREIKATFNPDVVHIHGTEYLESLLWVHANGVEHTVVSLQGIMKACCQYYYSGMSQWDVLSSITPRDLYRGTIFSKAHDFQCKAQYEQQLLLQVKHVIGRTTWDKTLLWSMNPNVEYHFNNEILREEFYDNSVWRYSECKKHSIFVSQASVPYKGLHQLVKALPRIKVQYPDVMVRVAGFNVCEKSFKRKLFREGYGRYLLKLLRKFDCHNNIEFLGPLNSQKMKKELLSANLFLLPSSIDNSPNALCEAQILGVPCVASRVGGVADLITDDDLGKMYRFSDVSELAYAVCSTFEISSSFDNKRMREVAAQRHDKKKNVSDLVEIYYGLV